GLEDLFLVAQGVAEVAIGHGAWLRGDGPVILGDRFVEPAVPAESDAKVHTRHRVVGAESQRDPGEGDRLARLGRIRPQQVFGQQMAYPELAGVPLLYLPQKRDGEVYFIGHEKEFSK